MSGWGNIDSVEDMPIWSCSTVNMENSTENAEKLYKNATLSDIVTDVTVGVSGITPEEVSTDNVCHTGWVKKTEGSGGRAGRIINEVLVAMSEMSEQDVEEDEDEDEGDLSGQESLETDSDDEIVTQEP